MRGSRGIVAGLAALAGVGAALIALPGPAVARGPRDCLLGCPATTSATTASTPPNGGPVTVSGVTPTSATVSGTYAGGSGLNNYSLQVLQGTTVTEASDPPEGQGGTPASTVSAQFTSLVPNTTYGARLEWQSDAGDSAPVPNYGPESTFTTPIEPAATPRLTLRRQAVVIGQQITLSAEATGAPFGAVAVLQGADAPFRTYRPFRNPEVSLPVESFLPPSGSETLTAEPQRNMLLRLSLPGSNPNPALGPSDHQIQQSSTSNAVFVYVFPLSSLQVTRPELDQARVEALAVYQTHAVSRGFRGESVFFYRSTGARGLARLIGRAVLRPTSDSAGVAYLEAHIYFADAGRGSFVSCVRHAVLPDMGVPFTDRACGRPTLHV